MAKSGVGRAAPHPQKQPAAEEAEEPTPAENSGEEAAAQPATTKDKVVLKNLAWGVEKARCNDKVSIRLEANVTWRAVFRIAIIGIGALGSSCTESSPRLCFSTRASFGQSLETLYCRLDSCYLMDFAAGLGGANSIGLFAAAVNRDNLAAGDDLVMRFLQADIPPMKHGPTSFSVSRNDTRVSIPRHPQTDSFYTALKMWVRGRKEDARATQLWRDSLILSGNPSGSREITIRLTPAQPGKTSYGEWVRLRMIHSLSDSAPDSLDSQVELPAATVKALLEGKAIQYLVQPRSGGNCSAQCRAEKSPWPKSTGCVQAKTLDKVEGDYLKTIAALEKQARTEGRKKGGEA